MSEALETAEDLLDTAREDPSAVDLDEALSLLDDEHPTARSIAMRAVAAVAADDPSRLAPHVDVLREGLQDSSLVAKTAAAGAYGHVAEYDTDLVADDPGVVIDLFDQNPPLLRYRAAMALRPVLIEDPEALAPHVEELIDVLVDGPRVSLPDPDDPEVPDDMRETVRSVAENRSEEFDKDKSRSQGVLELAANAVVEVAECAPEAVADHVETLAEALDSQRPIVRTPVVDAIGTVAEHDSDAAAPVVDDLRALLDDDAEYVQAHTVRALGFAEATSAAEDVRALAADEDVDENLRELAADTADWLENQR